MSDEVTVRDVLERGATRAKPSPNAYERILERVSRRRRRRITVMSTGTVALLLVVGTALWPFGGASRLQLDPSGTVNEWSWERTVLEGETGRMLDVAAADGVLVAVGRGEFMQPLFWRSTDGGRSWERGTSDDADEPAEPRSVIPFRGSFLAAGDVYVEDADESYRLGAVWMSADGAHWEKTVIEGACCISSIAEDGERAVVTAAGSQGSDPFAWWSEDGRRWHPATISRRPETPYRGGISTVAHGASGFVGFGGSGLPTREIEFGETPDETLPVMAQAIWVSSDGRTWEDISASVSGIDLYGAGTNQPGEPDMGGLLSLIASDGSSYVGLVNRRLSSEADLYWSEDGRMWNSVGRLGPKFTAMLDASMDGWIGMGTVATEKVPEELARFERELGRATIWGSDDGENWGVIARDDGEVFPSRVNGGGLMDWGIVLVGEERADGARRVEHQQRLAQEDRVHSAVDLLMTMDPALGPPVVWLVRPASV